MPVETLVSQAIIKTLELSPVLGIMVLVNWLQYRQLSKMLDDCWQHLLRDADRPKDESSHT